MKCQVCEKDVLKWWSKLPMAVGFPMKCKICDARYELSALIDHIPGFLKFFLIPIINLLTLTGYIPLILLVVWLGYTTSYLLAVALAIIAFLVIVLVTPYQLNLKDPVNAIIERIQAKKKKS